MMEEMFVGYEESLADPTLAHKPAGKDAAPVRFVLRQALKLKWSIWRKSGLKM
jgi:hypothetical protein